MSSRDISTELELSANKSTGTVYLRIVCIALHLNILCTCSANRCCLFLFLFVYFFLQIVSDMVNPEKGEELRKRIGTKPQPYDYYGPINYHIDVTEGTTHLSVLDKDGNAVSLTTSINK